MSMHIKGVHNISNLGSGIVITTTAIGSLMVMGAIATVALKYFTLAKSLLISGGITWVGGTTGGFILMGIARHLHAKECASHINTKSEFLNQESNL